MDRDVRSSYPVRGGNILRAWVDGLPAFTRICEVIESARSSVWVTVTVLRDGFAMPGSRGGLFDVLDAAVARGLDVRALFWRHGPETQRFSPIVFSGSTEQRRFLAARGSAVKIRWDRAGHGHAQHQKSWIMDAGLPTELAFVGGINCNPQSVAGKGHPEPRSTHDAYLELAGPAVTDVRHNFVQRWNAATERHRDDGHWPVDGVDDPTTRRPPWTSATAGTAICRMHPYDAIIVTVETSDIPPAWFEQLTRSSSKGF